MTPMLLFSILQAPAESNWLLVSDKIYSVMTVVLLVFGGLIYLLITTNRRMRALERQMRELEALNPISPKNGL